MCPPRHNTELNALKSCYIIPTITSSLAPVISMIATNPPACKLAAMPPIQSPPNPRLPKTHPTQPLQGTQSTPGGLPGTLQETGAWRVQLAASKSEQYLVRRAGRGKIPASRYCAPGRSSWSLQAIPLLAAAGSGGLMFPLLSRLSSNVSSMQ